MTEDSAVIPPDGQQQIAGTLENDAEVMSNTQIEELAAGEPEDVQAEILSINTDANDISLQVAMLVPILASLIGLINSLRMMRLPETSPPASGEVAVLG